MRGELLQKFVQKPTEEDTLLGRYLETKRVFYKKGQAPIETYDVEKLRLIENVPYKPRPSQIIEGKLRMGVKGKEYEVDPKTFIPSDLLDIVS